MQLTKGNKTLTLGCSISDLKDREGKKIGDIMIFQDLTAIIKMEEELNKSQRLAIIGEMAAGLAHEMRNPLASISGSIQILKKDVKLSDMDKRLMSIILRGKDQLDNIIKDFLLLARPATGNHEPLLMKEIIEDVVESVQYVPDWMDKIKVRLSFSDSAAIHANRTEMREVIWNLIVNAIQAMPDGGELSIETRNSTDNTPHGLLEILISDTGCGIEAEYLDEIFEPFYTTKERGTGLGLTIVNRIVERHGGTIRIESTPEDGTTCILRLPIR